MKKKLLIFCTFVAMICFSCIAMNFASEVNESETTQKEEILSETEESIDESIEESTEEEPFLEEEEPISEEIFDEFEEPTLEESLEESEEFIEKEVFVDVDKSTEDTDIVDHEKAIEKEFLDDDEESSSDFDDVIISSDSECQEEEELDVEYEFVSTPSNVSIKINWLSNVYLDDIGMGGSYDTNWKTYYVEENTEFETPDDIIDILNYDNCDQKYTLIGFTTNNQEDEYWLYADYASGEIMYDTSFIALEDIELWAVYEAKYEYVSSINIDGENVTYNETTIPNLAIKNVLRINNNAINDIDDREILENYMYKEFGDEIIFYTKDAKYGKPLTETDIYEIIKTK